MNVSIVTSFVIGGLMLLSILAYNRNLSETSQETTISTINQEKRDNLVKILTCDFNGIGYSNNVYANDPIETSEEKRIEFTTSPACVDGGDETNGEPVTLYADTTATVTATTNPNDYFLYRTDKNGTSSFSVTHFDLTYYKKNDVSGNWEEVSDPSSFISQRNVRVEVEIVIESGEPYRTNPSGEEVYHRTAWKRTFTPNIINHPWN